MSTWVARCVEKLSPAVKVGKPACSLGFKIFNPWNVKALGIQPKTINGPFQWGNGGNGLGWLIIYCTYRLLLTSSGVMGRPWEDLWLHGLPSQAQNTLTATSVTYNSFQRHWYSYSKCSLVTTCGFINYQPIKYFFIQLIESLCVILFGEHHIAGSAVTSQLICLLTCWQCLVSPWLFIEASGQSVFYYFSAASIY